jgi:hypothetical protein
MPSASAHAVISSRLESERTLPHTPADLIDGVFWSDRAGRRSEPSGATSAPDR